MGEHAKAIVAGIAALLIIIEQWTGWHMPSLSEELITAIIAVVGAIVLVGEKKSTFATVLGVIAIVAATSNVVGGFFITDRMLKMFKTTKAKKP